MNYIKQYWGIGVLLVAWLIFSKPYLLDGLMPFPSTYLVDFFQPWSYTHAMPVKNNAMPDVITQIYPWKKIALESWQDGSIPYWNPYQFGGNPLAANVQSAVFSPFNLLFFFLPFNHAWSMLILLQPLLAGLFMYLFLKHQSIGSLKNKTSKKQHSMSNHAAVIGSVGFMFCGFIVSWMAYGTLSYAALYMPLLLYAIDRLYRRKDSIAKILIPVAIVLSIYSGHVQTSIYVLLVGALYALWRGSDSPRKIRMYIQVGIAMLVGIVCSLPQLLPAIEFYEQSVRSSLFGRGGEVIPWNYIVTLLASDFFGNPVTRNDWFGHYAEWGGFIGVVPFVFAVCSLAAIKKERAVMFWALMALGSIVLAYSSTVVGILVSLKIPVLSTSAASRIIIVTSASISILSAYGVEYIRIYWDAKKFHQNKHIRFLLLGMLGIVVGVWVLLLAGNIVFVADIDAEKLSVAKRNFIIPTALVIGTAVSIVLTRILYSKKLFARYIVGGTLTILVLVGLFDSVRFAAKWMPFDPPEYIYPELSVISYLREFAGYHRVYGNVGNELFGTFGLYGLEGYDPLYIDRYGEFITALSDGALGTPERSVVRIDKYGKYTQKVFNMLGVKYLMHAKADARNPWAFPYWEHDAYRIDPVYSDDQYEVFINEQVYPRAYLVYDALVRTEDQHIVDTMFSDETDLRTTVVLEQEVDIDFGSCAGTQAGDTQVNIDTYQPNTITMQTQSECGSVLVLSDTYYPSWRVSIDGVEGDILRANYAFRAVVIPEGEHTIEFSL